MKVHLQSESRQPGDDTLYVRELLHRISNEYTNAISFAHNVARRSSSEEARTVADKIADRLLALANAHRALYPPTADEPADLADNLSRLCRDMTSAWLAPGGITLQLAMPGPIFLGRKVCWRVCLIVSELITNASRHASLLGHGCVSVSIEVVSGRVLCRVSDDGSPALTYVPGRGSRLVDALAKELAGSVERQFGQSGTTVLLSFPMDSVAIERQPGRGAKNKNAQA
jgi:two-component sensor histidine kinase